MTKYIPIRVSTLRGDAEIPFNAYVQVAGKQILMCRQGDSFEGPRLERLKGKKLVKMFVPEEQAAAYHRYITENITRAYENKSQNLEYRTQIIHGALQAAAEELMEDPSNQASYAVAIEGARRFNKFLREEPMAIKPIIGFPNVDYSVAHHGVTVATLSLAVADEMKFTESRPMQMETLATGCMIHDIEHNFNHINLSIPPEKLTGAEKIRYESHGIAGFERLKDFHFYDPMVRDVIRYHEEKIDGTGPMKLKLKNTDPLVVIAAAANAFDHYFTYEKLDVKDALKRMLIDKMGLVDLDTMKALQEVLKKRSLV